MEPIGSVKILKSLADETRLLIVRKLASDDCEIASNKLVANCARVLELSQPTMSHHFKLLVQADVLRERKVGTEKFYRLNHELLLQHGIDPQKL